MMQLPPCLLTLVSMLVLSAEPPLVPAPKSTAGELPGIIVVVGGVGGLDYLGGAAQIGLPRGRDP